ncbi:heteroglycan glucosidase 1 [Actinidia rufa]|uniref:Heteroglycan glucosidase 1 n=1 Tax=Actinidia rufa TaxID=165716 RepID=A0A7J0GZV2_9ERIC|nr:heteroglycan glucosidase 1 [Actinidia rufa]
MCLELRSSILALLACGGDMKLFQYNSHCTFVHIFFLLFPTFNGAWMFFSFFFFRYPPPPPTDLQLKLTSDFIFVSTISDQGTDQQQHVLPKGIWLSFDFGDSHPDLPALYLQGGSIIPMGPAIQHVGEANPTDDLALLVALDEHELESPNYYEASAVSIMKENYNSGNNGRIRIQSWGSGSVIGTIWSTLLLVSLLRFRRRWRLGRFRIPPPPVTAVTFVLRAVNILRPLACLGLCCLSIASCCLAQLATSHSLHCHYCGFYAVNILRHLAYLGLCWLCIASCYLAQPATSHSLSRRYFNVFPR